VAGGVVERVDSRSGYVPQKYSLFPERTVLENLTMGPETSKYHVLGRLLPGFRAFRREVRAEAMRQLAHMGLQASDAKKYPHQLSGGMQQRVAIAQALMMKSRVLLMDEAFSALDPATRASLQRLLRSVWTESRPTIVFVTHNTAEALYLGTRVIVLARKSREDHCGAQVALDMKLPGDGMSLSKHGQHFLDLVEHVESFSRGAHHGATEDTETPEAPNAFPNDGETQS
jgi:NitT/TauT family transport system ATP-binding protein